MRETLEEGFIKCLFGYVFVLCHCCVYCNQGDCSFPALNYLYFFFDFLVSVLLSCPEITNQVLKGGYNRSGKGDNQLFLYFSSHNRLYTCIIHYSFIFLTHIDYMNFIIDYNFFHIESAKLFFKFFLRFQSGMMFFKFFFSFFMLILI